MSSLCLLSPSWALGTKVPPTKVRCRQLRDGEDQEEGSLCPLVSLHGRKQHRSKGLGSCDQKLHVCLLSRSKTVPAYLTVLG